MTFSATGLLNDTKIGLEQVATDKFGASVESFVKTNLTSGAAGAGSSTDAQAKAQADARSKNTREWVSTSYAAALGGGTEFRPKLSFLFQVEVIFAEAAKKAILSASPAILSQKDLDVLSQNKFSFMVQKVDRPKANFEYDTEVNMYNFRTKVLKKIHHPDVSLTFLDDVGNSVFDLFRTILWVYSPITRGPKAGGRDNSLNPPDVSDTSRPQITTGSGMTFANVIGNTSHRAVVNSTFGNLIDTIRVKQFYVDPTSGISDMSKMVVYDYINPCVISFEFDELSHEANEASKATLVFNYDWAELVKVGSVNGADPSGSKRARAQSVKAPGITSAPLDFSPGPGGSSKQSGGGVSGVIGNVLSGSVGRSAQQLTSDVLGKSVSKLAGNGPLASSLSGMLTSNVSGAVGSLVQGNVGSSFSSGVSSVSNFFSSLSSKSTVADSTQPGESRTVASTVSAPPTGG